jgi:uncharacterized membrane protein
MKKGVKKRKKLGPEFEKLGKKMVNIGTTAPDLFSKLNKPFKSPTRTIGQKAADWLTKWAGSWVFIILLGVIMVIWIVINSSWLIFGREWDPYPFILLNFVLSTLAAIQAPIILMSQNRTGQKDRARSEYDYAVNKKAEREIRQVQAQLTRIERRMFRKK